MVRFRVVARAAALVAVACVLTFGTVSSAHVHLQGADGTLNALCQLCSLGQARLDLAGILPGIGAFMLLAWLSQPPGIQAPSRHSTYSPSPRAPPLR